MSWIIEIKTILMTICYASLFYLAFLSFYYNIKLWYYFNLTLIFFILNRLTRYYFYKEGEKQ
jgi:1-acyl-sn-glycerol-3-phosphate acyltransferase